MLSLLGDVETVVSGIDNLEDFSEISDVGTVLDSSELRCKVLHIDQIDLVCSGTVVVLSRHPYPHNEVKGTKESIVPVSSEDTIEPKELVSSFSKGSAGHI